MSDVDLYKDAAWSSIVAQAAAWIALLHGPDRSSATEEGFRRWLAEDPVHRQAFELATDTWNESRSAIRRTARVKLALPGDRSEAPGWRWLSLGALATGLAAIVILAFFYIQEPAVSTQIGERRILALEDGTQVFLNTASRVIVDYSSQRRLVRLEAGEALFDVAKRSNWPFVVIVGDRHVTALGTAFLVRRDEDAIAVTLVEGKVAISSNESVDADVPLLEDGSTVDHAPSTIILAPGERLLLAEHRDPKLDRPEIEKLTAWQRGRVHIDDMTLAEAIAEMNRYSTLKLAIDGEQAAAMRMSGVFKAGDSKNFAQAVALTYGLHMQERGRSIVLSGAPYAPNEERLDSHLGVPR